MKKFLISCLLVFTIILPTIAVDSIINNRQQNECIALYESEADRIIEEAKKKQANTPELGFAETRAYVRTWASKEKDDEVDRQIEERKKKYEGLNEPWEFSALRLKEFFEESEKNPAILNQANQFDRNDMLNSESESDNNQTNNRSLNSIFLIVIFILFAFAFLFKS